MLDILPESGGNVIGAHIAATMSGDECRLLARHVEELVGVHERVRLLLDLSDCNHVELAAAWEEFVMGVKHWNDLERIAIVGDAKWNAIAAHTLNRIAYADAEHFSTDEIAGAWVWIRR